MESQLIFDLKEAGYPWQYLTIGLLVAASMGSRCCFRETSKRV